MLCRSILQANPQIGKVAFALLLLPLAGCQCYIDSIRTTSLPPARVGIAYDFTLTHNCDGEWTTDDAEWEVREGTLPPGISLSRDGRLSGMPRTAGEYQFTVNLHHTRRESGGEGDSSRPLMLTVL